MLPSVREAMVIVLAGCLRHPLPLGIELSDGRVLCFPAHGECPCSDCVDAWREYGAGTLILPTPEMVP